MRSLTIFIFCFIASSTLAELDNTQDVSSRALSVKSRVENMKLETDNPYQDLANGPVSLVTKNNELTGKEESAVHLGRRNQQFNSGAVRTQPRPNLRRENVFEHNWENKLSRDNWNKGMGQSSNNWGKRLQHWNQQNWNNQLGSNFNNKLGYNFNNKLGYNFENKLGYNFGNGLGYNFDNKLGYDVGNKLGYNVNDKLGYNWDNKQGYNLNNLGYNLDQKLGYNLNNNLGYDLQNKQGSSWGYQFGQNLANQFEQNTKNQLGLNFQNQMGYNYKNELDQKLQNQINHQQFLQNLANELQYRGYKCGCSNFRENMICPNQFRSDEVKEDEIFQPYLGGRGQNPETWGQHPEKWGHYPEIWGQYPEAWGQYPGTWGQYPATWGQYPILRNKQ